jgi:hypothetical protein
MVGCLDKQHISQHARIIPVSHFTEKEGRYEDYPGMLRDSNETAKMLQILQR